jgi:competence protein ComEA
MSSPSHSPPATDFRLWLFRPADQSAVAIFMSMALAAMCLSWIAEGIWGMGLVEADDNAQKCVARFQIDINAADRLELMQLPGIGDALSQRIIEIRQTAGPFAKVDDLRRVRGIGPKILDRLRPYLLPIQKGEETMNNEQ